MIKYKHKSSYLRKKDILLTETRKKLGLTQIQMGSIFGLSRSFVGHVESKKRNYHSVVHAEILQFYIQFNELEKGTRPAQRSLETRLFLNAEYKKALPVMKKMEQDCREQVKQLEKKLKLMKEEARLAEHSIIVYTMAVNNRPTDDKATKKSMLKVESLTLAKEQAYIRLLTNWEPEQAKLQAKIEAITGEARALRRYRVKITNEHNPLKIKKRK